MEDAGLTKRVNVAHAPDFSPASGAAAAKKVLARNARPTAIMCANDRLALGVLRAAAQLGLHVPGDVAVTGFNDFDFAAMTTPSLSTVRIPGYEMGLAAATSLIGIAVDEKTVPSSLYEVELHLRESTGD
jgi:DNA-binding LacI/PurR family transcriptional regulator